MTTETDAELVEMLRARYPDATNEMIQGWLELHRECPTNDMALEDQRITAWANARRDAAVAEALQRISLQDKETQEQLNAALREVNAKFLARDAQIARLTSALEPFATFGMTDDGDIRDGLMRDRICDWFGPSDFDGARAALSPPTEGNQ